MLRKLSALFYVWIFIAAIISTGCGQGESPTTPDNSLDTTPPVERTMDANHHLWGFYNVSIDPETHVVTVDTLRSAQFTCNVTQFMQPPIANGSLLHIVVDEAESDFTTGYVVADATFIHPFPALRQYRGFDVRGIVMGGGSENLATGGLSYAGEDDLMLLNPDGWTRWWNPTEFAEDGSIFSYLEGIYVPGHYFPSATLNSYKYFADELGLHNDLELDPDNRGTFSTTPGVNSRRYIIQFPGGVQPAYNFAYAIDASWYTPDESFAPHFPLEAFSLNANCAEPYLITVTDLGSSAWYESETSKGGSLILDVEVFDWQASDNPDGIEGEISGLWLDGDIFSSPVNIADSALIIPTGPTSGIFRAEITDLNLTHPGVYEFWVIAENANPSSYEPQIPMPTYPYTWPAGNLACYAKASIEVAVTAPQFAPTVTDITPEEGVVNTSVPATITGMHFADGCTVELREASGEGMFIIQGENINVYQDGTKISCTFDLTGATTGPFDVAVINPSMLEGVLPEGFEVTAVGYIIYVDSSNTSGYHNGTETYPYPTIGQALNAAPPGSIIWVDDSGTPYTEQVVMVQGVDLISVNFDDSDGDGEAWIRPSVGVATVVVGAVASRIEGFEIDGIYGAWNATNGIVCDGTTMEIVDCRVHDFLRLDATGITLMNGSHSLIDRVHVYNINNNTYNQSSYFYGIKVENCDGSGDDRVVIDHTIVHDVYASGYYDGINCRPQGILIENSSGVRVANTIVYGIRGGHNNQVCGIKTEYSNDIELHNITIYDIYKTYNSGSAYGVRMEYSDNVDVRNLIINYVRKSLSGATAYAVSQFGSSYYFEYSNSYFCSTGLYDNVIPGPGCISYDPRFVNPGVKDFHLWPVSPCMNTGDPAMTDYDGTPCDMGAYGGQGGNW